MVNILRTRLSKRRLYRTSPVEASAEIPGFTSAVTAATWKTIRMANPMADALHPRVIWRQPLHKRVTELVSRLIQGLDQNRLPATCSAAVYIRDLSSPRDRVRSFLSVVEMVMVKT
jgi:hypothetical protein